MIDAATFLVIHDEFSSEKPEKVQYYLDVATNRIDMEIFGIHTDDAIRLLTAHLLTINPSRKTTPEAIAQLGFKAEDVKSIEITDDMKVDFNAVAKQGSPFASSSNSGLDATSYGQQLEALKRSLIIPFTFT